MVSTRARRAPHIPARPGLDARRITPPRRRCPVAMVPPRGPGTPGPFHLGDRSESFGPLARTTHGRAGLDHPASLGQGPGAPEGEDAGEGATAAEADDL